MCLLSSQGRCRSERPNGALDMRALFSRTLARMAIALANLAPAPASLRSAAILNLGEDFGLEFGQQPSIFVDHARRSRIRRTRPVLEGSDRRPIVLAKRTKAGILQGRFFDLHSQLAKSTEDMI